MTLGVGVVGLGIAGSAMIGAIHSHPGVYLAAAVDPHPALRARFTKSEGLPCYGDLESLLAQSTVDIVYVASPHQFHCEQAVASMRAGRHVIVEKPMSLSVDECDAMIAASAATDRMLVVGHSHGFDPAVALIAELVREQLYGRVGLIATWNYTDFLYRPRRPEELDESRGGGIFLNQLPHQIDMVRTICRARVASVSARGVLLDPLRRVPGAHATLVDFDDGSTASLVYSGYDHFDSAELGDWVAEGGGRKVPAHGSARARLRGLSVAEETRARTATYGFGVRTAEAPLYQPRFGELVVSCESADLRIGANDVVAYTDEGLANHEVAPRPWWPGRGDVIEELVAGVERGCKPFHDGRFGRESLRVCLAIQLSARRREEVHHHTYDEVSS